MQRHTQLFARYSDVMLQSPDRAVGPPGRVDDADAHEIDEAIGITGTRVRHGRIYEEPSTRYRPHQVRGRNSRPGVYDELPRQSPIVFRHLRELMAVLKRRVEIKLVIDQDADPVSAALAERADEAVKGISSGYDRRLSDLYTAIQYGFTPVELLWDRSRDGIWLDDMLYRKQGTVDRWAFSEHDNMAGIFHQASQSTGGLKRWFAPSDPTDPRRYRAEVATVGQVGSNVEGLPPTRPVVHYVRSHQLLMQIYPIAYQRHGMPVPIVEDDPASYSPDTKLKTPSDTEVADFMADLDRLRAQEAPSLRVPPGLKVEWMTPTNELPDPRPIVEWLATMISMPFLAEGTILGQGSVGSYGLGEVSDERWTRQVEDYGQDICEMFTRIAHAMIEWNGGTSTVGIRYEAVERVRRVGDNDESAGEQTTEQTQSFNGAQITSMKEVVMAVSDGELSETAGIEILKAAFDFSQEKAEAFFADPSPNPAPTPEEAE